MTFTYDTSLTKNKDKVRITIGDTDCDNPQFGDAEINYFLEKNDDSVINAAIEAAGSLYAKYSRKVDMKLESASISYSQLARNYKDLAFELERKKRLNRNGGAGIPMVSGVSESTINSVAEDKDRIDSKFRREQFDNHTTDYEPENYRG